MKNIILLNLILLLSHFVFGQDESFTSLNYTCKDNTERPFVVYTPKNLDKNIQKPLLIYLHGAISNPKLKKNPVDYMKKSPLISLAEKGEFYLMFCFGQKGATWFDAVGGDMIMGEIDMAQQQFNIDKNKVFISGFSDGGSGVYYLSMTNPIPFAGFIAMNGNLKVAEKLGEKPMFPSNMNNKPIYIINTQNDMLYPINQIIPTIDYLKKFNRNIIFKQPEGNHEMSYLKTEQEDIISFINQYKRTENRTFSWETSTPQDNIINGITILELDTLASPKTWHQPYGLKVLNDKAYFGLKYDYRYQGEGLKVKEFKNDTCTALKMGVKVGDVILMMGQDTINTPYAPFYYKSKKKAGDETSLTILRGNEKKVLNGKFNNGYYYQVFNNKEKSAKLTAEIEGEKLTIKTSRIKSFSLDMDKLSDYHIKKLQINDKIYEANGKGKQIIKVE